MQRETLTPGGHPIDQDHFRDRAPFEEARRAQYVSTKELRAGMPLVPSMPSHKFKVGGSHIQERIYWQEAAELLMAAAEDGARVKDAIEQIEMALFLEARLAI